MTKERTPLRRRGSRGPAIERRSFAIGRSGRCSGRSGIACSRSSSSTAASRSAGKAFVSFFPLVIVVASFMPHALRDSIFTTLTHRLGIEGDALVTAKEAFASADDIRKATGILGLVLTFFFASSFTTALQRVYLRAWRRPPGKKAGEYARGPAWFLGVLAYMALLGGLRAVLGDGPQCRRVRRHLARGRRPRCGGSPPGSCSWARCDGGSWSRPAWSPASRWAATRCRRRSGCRTSSPGTRTSSASSAWRSHS